MLTYQLLTYQLLVLSAHERDQRRAIGSWLFWCDPSHRANANEFKGTLMHDPAQMTIGEAAAAIKAGKLKPSELVDACLARAREVEGDVRAWAYLGADKARMAARLADQETPTGALFGMPFGVKDIIETADMPTGYGTPIYHDHQPARDAACVALLRETGGICLGKAVTTELAHFHPGKTRNPHALTHTPGGSSSGSAAAVAACMVPFALGTQTTGSVLRPASYCGVYGFKPSYGDVSRSGVLECVASFDTVGWFARCIGDVEFVREGLIRAPHKPLATKKLSELRIGLLRGPDWSKAADYTQGLIEGAVDILAKAGGTITPVEAPPEFGDIPTHHRTIAGYEFARAITWERTQRAPLLSPKLVDGRCADGMTTSYEDYTAAQQALVEARRAFGDWMQSFDVLLTPAAPGEAWEGLGATGDPVFNTAWTALHVPALSAPTFTGPTGLPVGLQLVGKFRQDAALLGAAEAVCAALDIGIVRGV
jgi:Asp-tRNA(Asn)/Glu-tRNA(Gln) amidotransferase A subunit family amidase